ncbi:MAG: hypothetical protein IJU19_08490 [Bacteroidales bacterium]|nr:hypothetical protein [Bacteroidales bacterium]
MKQSNPIWKKVALHGGLVLAMLALACIYFSPVLGGKVVNQGDTQMVEAMMKETKDYHAQTGDYALWNSAMFSGMPIYQVGGNPPTPSLFTPLQKLGTLQVAGMDVARSIGVLFFYLIGFYVALLALGCSPWLALFGAIAFGLGSYNIIIIEAGHITKAWAMAMIAPVLAGMVLCLRKKADRATQWRDWLWGGLLFTLALGLQLMCNHIQITYYTIIAALLLGLTYLGYAIAEKRLPQLTTGVGVLLLGCGLAFACNARNLMVSQQYTAYTMRGGNVITATPADLYHDGTAPSPESNRKSGLDIDYAFSWSYGVGETYTLLVPGAMGGGSGEWVGKESASYKAFRQQQMPLYWGDQPFTSGPVYFGAIVVFLALLGLLLVKGPERWWLLAATVVAVMMSWGRNMMWLNEWLFNHLPLYNKFRTPSMALVLANVCMVLLGVLGIRELMSDKVESKRKRLALYIAGGTTAGVLLIGLLLSSGFSYSGRADEQMAAQYGDQWGQILDIFMQDRQALFVGDSWRSLLFVALAFAALWLYLRTERGGKRQGMAIGVSLALVALVMIDLWGVDSRYLNEKNYVSARKVQLRPDPWDATIDDQAARFGDQDYRVLNLAVNTFNSSKSAAFHHQVGGYSAVKMRRYQDLIDFYLAGHINQGVLNMLNTRYIVLQGGQVQRNPEALGNCWFASEVKEVADANGEILSLADADLSRTAVVNRTEFAVSLPEVLDSTATIAMEHQTPYNPDHLKYTTRSRTPQLAVFSEVYYEPDWRAYIDGKPAEYIRANYLLRAMMVPAGEHVVEFRNEAPLFHQMNRVALIGSIVLVLLATGALIVYYRKRKETAC